MTAVLRHLSDAVLTLYDKRKLHLPIEHSDYSSTVEFKDGQSWLIWMCQTRYFIVVSIMTLAQSAAACG